MPNCQDIIYSNDYVDYTVEYSGGVKGLMESYQPSCYEIVDNTLAVIQIPFTRADQVPWRSYQSFSKVYGLSDTSNVEDIGVLRLRRQPYINLYGQDVIIGIVDTGIDYTHPVFRFENGDSRIQAIWDQTIPYKGENPPMGYGTIYAKEQLDEALQSENPFDIVPTNDPIGHGTFLAGVAAGNIMESDDFTGVAPLSNIVAVKLKQAKQYLRDFAIIPDGVPCYQETDIILGIRFLLNYAIFKRQPIVLLIGINTTQGDHNGNSRLAVYLNRLTNMPGLTVVIAGGNEGNIGHHYKGMADQTIEYQDIELRVGEEEEGFLLEFWAESPDLYSVGFISPTGEYTQKIPIRLGFQDEFSFVFEPTVIFLSYNVVEASSGDLLIWMRIKQPTPGIWRIRIFPEETLGGRYDLWLPKQGFITDDTYFVNSDPDTTICGPGDAPLPITVAAYNAQSGSIYINSSRGYTRDNGIKPDITAPGVNIYGPGPRGQYITMTGTSVAAAQVAGIAALLLENNTRLSGVQLKKYLIKGANRRNITYPNKEWGYGTVDLYRTFESMRMTI